MRRYPQVMENVSVRSLAELDGSSVVRETVRAVEEQLADTGRVLVRASGTEPLVRVMVEAESEEDARRYVDRIADAVRAELGA
jgi:phosphoglucosamine mutase